MTAEKSLPRIKEISLDRREQESGEIVLTVKNVDGFEFHGAITSADVGHLVASLVTSVGQALDKGGITLNRANLASTRVFIPGMEIGFGSTVSGPVLVAQTGGLALIFSTTDGNLIGMAKQILEDLEDIEEMDRPPRHH